MRRSLASSLWPGIYQNIEVSWNRGTPKSSILVACSIINHPILGYLLNPIWFPFAFCCRGSSLSFSARIFEALWGACCAKTALTLPATLAQSMWRWAANLPMFYGPAEKTATSKVCDIPCRLFLDLCVGQYHVMCNIDWYVYIYIIVYIYIYIHMCIYIYTHVYSHMINIWAAPRPWGKYTYMVCLQVISIMLFVIVCRLCLCYINCTVSLVLHRLGGGWLVEASQDSAYSLQRQH